MRPVEKGAWPLTPVRQRKKVFTDWTSAIPILKDRTGKYCHICEMKVTNAMAIEHIKPRIHFPKLRSHWDNFLLTCNSCNSHKSNSIPLSPYRKMYFWPHKNNTLLVFEYGTVLPFIRPAVLPNRNQRARAVRLIRLYGLNKQINQNGEPDTRWIEKCSALRDAIDSRIEYLNGLTTIASIIRNAKSAGFFSIWLTVFNNEMPVKNALINCPDFHLGVTNCYNAALQLQNRTATDI